MPCIITYKQNITTKDGRAFVIYRGILDNGDNFQAFLSAEQAESFAIPDTAVFSKKDLESLFAEAEVAKIMFDQRGRVHSLEV